jgi:hypothetical protein
MNLVGSKFLSNSRLCSVTVIWLLQLEQHKVVKISFPSSVLRRAL